jgi:hypothetical protein
MLAADSFTSQRITSSSDLVSRGLPTGGLAAMFASLRKVAVLLGRHFLDARRATFLLVACLVGASAHADLAANIVKCRALKEPVERLACFDAIVPPSATAEAPGATTDPARQDADPRQSFGLATPKPAQTIEAIESSIVGTFDGWELGTQIRLSNGQIWQVIDDTRGAFSLRDPAVRVVRGVLGSHFMEIAGVTRAPRVRRIK